MASGELLWLVLAAVVTFVALAGYVLRAFRAFSESMGEGQQRLDKVQAEFGEIERKHAELNKEAKSAVSTPQLEQMLADATERLFGKPSERRRALIAR